MFLSLANLQLEKSLTKRRLIFFQDPYSYGGRTNMVNSSSKSFQGATQLDASVSCKLWNILNHEFSPNITKEMFIAYRFIRSCSFPFSCTEGSWIIFIFNKFAKESFYRWITSTSRRVD